MLVYFFYCYNFMVGTFIKPTMIAEVGVGGVGFTIQQTEAIFASMSLGTIPGTIIFGILSSKIGKKYTLSIIALLIAISTFVPMLSPQSYNIWRMSRFVTGITLSGVFGTAMPLVAEKF